MSSLFLLRPSPADFRVKQVVRKVLRGMAEEGKQFSFTDFKDRLEGMEWVRGQSGPLDMRLRLLESFLDCDGSQPPAPKSPKGKSKGKPPKPGANAPAVWVKGPRPQNDGWKFERGSFTIIDLSCPFVDVRMMLAHFSTFVWASCDESGIGRRALGVQRTHLPPIDPSGPYIPEFINVCMSCLFVSVTP
jgi:hypothetical protein